MQVLLWLLIPLAGLIIGAGWVMWRSRPKRTPDAEEGMAELNRIRQAMNQPLPSKNKQRVQVHTEPLDDGVRITDAPKSSARNTTTSRSTETRNTTAPDASFRKSA